MKKRRPLFKLLGHVASDRRGATAVEYALILAAIMLAIFALLSQIGINLSAVLGGLADRLTAATR